jgi:cytidylate kinase
MLLFELVPSYIVSIFGGQANNLEFYQGYACLAFRIYLGGILLCCIQKASCTFLQSIDKPYKAMTLSLMRDVILLVPGVSILGLTGGLYRMLLAGPIADIGSFIVTVIIVTIECKKISKLAKENIEEQHKEVEKIADIKEKFVISIGREFGSGGKYIGQELAKRLNVKFYDNELVSKVSENYHIDMETLEKVDEKQKSSFWYGFATNYVFSSNDEVSPISVEDNLFLKQAKVIEDIYNNNESSIIVGRCSDYILKDKENVIKLFIYSSDMEFKINRKGQYEKLNKTIAEKKIKQIDKQRAEYYKHFTSQTWGDRNNYDLCIDTSKLSVEETIDVLEDYINARIRNYKYIKR